MPSPDEVKFIRWWRKNGPEDGLIKWHSYAGEDEAFELGLIENARSEWWGSCQQITPRGRDIVATADAIGFDPDAVEDSAEPEVPECSECGGSGRVAVIGSFTNPCRACSSVEHWAAKVGRQIAADLEAMWVKPSRLSSDDFDEQPVGFTFKSPIQRLKEIAARVPTFSTGALTKREAQPVSFTFGGVPISPIRRLPPPIQVQSQPVAAERLPDSEEFRDDSRGVRRVCFGKHLGKELKDVPDEYLAWMDGSFFFGEGTQAILTREVLSRQIDAARIAPPVVSVTNATVDPPLPNIVAGVDFSSSTKDGTVTMVWRGTPAPIERVACFATNPNTSAPDLPDSIACPNPRGIDPSPPGAGED